MDGTPIARRGDVILITYPDGSGQCFRGDVPAGPRKPDWHGFIKDAYWESLDNTPDGASIPISSPSKEDG